MRQSRSLMEDRGFSLQWLGGAREELTAAGAEGAVEEERPPPRVFLLRSSNKGSLFPPSRLIAASAEGIGRLVSSFESHSQVKPFLLRFSASTACSPGGGTEGGIENEVKSFPPALRFCNKVEGVALEGPVEGFLYNPPCCGWWFVEPQLWLDLYRSRERLRSLSAVGNIIVEDAGFSVVLSFLLLKLIPELATGSTNRTGAELEGTADGVALARANARASARAAISA